MRRRLVAALMVVVSTAGCTRNAGQVAGEEVPLQSPGPTASPTPTPTVQPVPVALEGPVNNVEISDLTGMGNAVTAEFTMADFAFNPTFVKTIPGANLRLTLKNPGGLADHTFTIDSLGVHRRLKPGEDAEMVIQLPVSGAFRFYCKFHAGKGMQGAFYFAEGDPISPVTISPEATAPRASAVARRPARPSPSGAPPSAAGDDDNDVDVPDNDDLIQVGGDGMIVEGIDGSEGQAGKEGSPGEEGAQGSPGDDG